MNNSWVTDMANILSDSTETQLNQMISDLEAAKGTEIAVQAAVGNSLKLKFPLSRYCTN
ncbi:MAG: TPM domain-containing protein [Cyanobacteriota bacterium]|nr:TPM domain-containing protein [Cyanobacteriota bacterium]